MVDEDILKRYNRELSVINGEPEPQVLQVEVQSIEIEIYDNQQKLSDYDSFLQEGKLPEEASNLSIKDNLILSEYANLIMKVMKAYPFVANIEYSQYDQSFDPNLDIWDIKDVENAMKKSFIRKVIASIKSNTNITNLLEDTKKNIDILNWFVNGDAFGT